jgi:hypothetical protein
LARSLQNLTRRIATSGIFKEHDLGLQGGCSQTTANSNMSRAAEAAMAASYKSLKEDFVSNLTGGEIGEINYVAAVAPVSSSIRISNSSNLWEGSSNYLVCITITAFIL